MTRLDEIRLRVDRALAAGDATHLLRIIDAQADALAVADELLMSLSRDGMYWFTRNAAQEVTDE